jgi:SET domain-containing protein
LFDEDFYFIPDYGFKLVDLVIYLNHSETPNVISLNDGEQFEAIRDIANGEELLVDYGTIVESEE